FAFPMISRSPARVSGEIPSPGRTTLARSTPITTDTALRIPVKSRVRAPTRPRRLTSPSSATPRMRAVTTRGMTTMKMRRRKICPTGTVTQAMKAARAGVSPKSRWAATPRSAPAIIPMRMRAWSGMARRTAGNPSRRAQRCYNSPLHAAGPRASHPSPGPDAADRRDERSDRRDSGGCRTPREGAPRSPEGGRAGEVRPGRSPEGAAAAGRGADGGRVAHPQVPGAAHGSEDQQGIPGDAARDRELQGGARRARRENPARDGGAGEAQRRREGARGSPEGDAPEDRRGEEGAGRPRRRPEARPG